jgi:pimeloyl-ACP methyl ester carboxylesterase
MLSESFLQTAETRLNLATIGDGPPLVLVHGVTRAWQDFSTVIPALAARWRLVAPDLRGHGRSERKPGGYQVVDYVRDIVQLVDRFLDEPAILFGHSLGAMVALAVAAERPGRVRGVILEDPPFETMGERIGQSALLGYFQQLQKLVAAGLTVAELANALADVRMTPPDATSPGPRLGDLRDAATIRLAAACLAAADPEIFRPIVAHEWLRGYSVEQLLRQVQSPVLLLQGDPALGGMLVDADVRLAQEILADCTHVRMANVGHQIHWQQTEATLRVVAGFVESLGLQSAHPAVMYADPIPKRF